jgi:hypothetical protein
VVIVEHLLVHQSHDLVVRVLRGILPIFQRLLDDRLGRGQDLLHRLAGFVGDAQSPGRHPTADEYGQSHRRVQGSVAFGLHLVDVLQDEVPGGVLHRLAPGLREGGDPQPLNSGLLQELVRQDGHRPGFRNRVALRSGRIVAVLVQLGERVEVGVRDRLRQFVPERPPGMARLVRRHPGQDRELAEVLDRVELARPGFALDQLVQVQIQHVLAGLKMPRGLPVDVVQRVLSVAGLVGLEPHDDVVLLV